MERFRADGHLTDEALSSLLQDSGLDELARLEIAEHLSFCDLCLQRYTQLLSGGELLTPDHSCRQTLWVRVRRRTLRLVTSRYATAAAAVALALTMLWGGEQPGFSRPVPADTPSPIVEHLRSWPERWNGSLSQAVSGLSDFFDGLGRP